MDHYKENAKVGSATENPYVVTRGCTSSFGFGPPSFFSCVTCVVLGDTSCEANVRGITLRALLYLRRLHRMVAIRGGDVRLESMGFG